MNEKELKRIPYPELPIAKVGKNVNAEEIVSGIKEKFNGNWTDIEQHIIDAIRKVEEEVTKRCKYLTDASFGLVSDLDSPFAVEELLRIVGKSICATQITK